MEQLQGNKRIKPIKYVNVIYILYAFIFSLILLIFVFGWDKYVNSKPFKSSSSIESGQTILTKPDEKKNNPVVKIDECEESSTSTSCDNTDRQTPDTPSSNILTSTSSGTQFDSYIKENSPYPVPQSDENVIQASVSGNIKQEVNDDNITIDVDIDLNNPQTPKTFFNYEAPLKIENLGPSYGSSGELNQSGSIIYGTGFMKEGNIINFGSTKIYNVKSNDGTMITLIVPKIIPGSDPKKPEYLKAGKYLVSVTTDSGTSNAFTYTLKTPETLASESSCTISARKQTIMPDEEVYLEWAITGEIAMFFVDNNINQDIYIQDEWRYKLGESNGGKYLKPETTTTYFGKFLGNNKPSCQTTIQVSD